MNIAIITGGTSGEREVSINSAKNIADSIKFAPTQTFVFPADQERFIKESSQFDVAIPMIHGAGGEDGELQEFLETLKVPFIFSSAAAHKIGIDKHQTKVLANKLGINTPQEITAPNLTFPLFAKPRTGGSSIASQFCAVDDDLNRLKHAHPNIEFILEQPIKGREFTVGVIDQDGQSLALPVIEIIPQTDFFNYESKYNADTLADEVCPANINEELAKQLQEDALRMHKEIGVKHISRSDFLMDDSGVTYFLEINTIPGMTNTSLVPKMLKQANVDLENLLTVWIDEVK